MSSRFFMSDSESESSSDSEEYVKEPTGVSAGISAFAFSDDEEEQKRIVRSAKEKRYEELNNIIKNIKNYKRNKDLMSLLSSFEELCKAHQKALAVILKEEGGKTPRFFVRCLCELEDYITQSWDDKDGRKSMSKNNAKSLTTLRQKFRKYIRDFEEDMNTFKEKPDETESESEAEEADQDSDASDDEDVMEMDFKKAPVVPKEEKKKVILDDDSDDDSDEWPTESDESSSSDDEKNLGQMSTRDRFLKKPEAMDKGDKVKKDKVEKKKLKKDQKDESDEDDDEEGWQKVNKHAVPIEKPKMFAKDDEITIPSVVKKLCEIMAARGKKGTNRKEQIELLHELYNIAKDKELGDPILIKIHFNIITAIFDYNPSVSEPMKADFWEKVILKIDEILDMLIKTDDLTIGEDIIDELESLETAPFKVRGCILTVVERMDSEFIKLLKSCDAHSNEYVQRLRDEIKTCSIIDKLEAYLEANNGLPADKCRIYLRKIEHIYYKYDEKSAGQVKGRVAASEETAITQMDKLCQYIYVSDTTDRLRTRAVLCHIYHMSLHDKWYQARDLMLMAHLQETIQHSDLPTQILYNRTMVQLGLCAFRHGHVRDSHNALLDIQSGGRAKELLAQGLLPQRQHERTNEQEKMEKQRQIPFHQHINHEMLECVYLASAMLIEIPYMAAHQFDARRRMISKSFHHQLKNSERQSLVGPPESMREHVVAASKAMRNGNWRKCRDLLLNPKMNTKVWDLFHEPDSVRSMLALKVQEESLRTYLFTYSHVYDSISLNTLSEMYELPYRTVHAIISKMIINEEIMASLDEPTKCLVMHRTEPSALQSLSLQCSDKLYNLVENNERVFDQKPFFPRGGNQGGGGGYRDRQKGGGGGHGGGGGGGGGGWNDRRDNRRDNRRDRD